MVNRSPKVGRQRVVHGGECCTHRQQNPRQRTQIGECKQLLQRRRTRRSSSCVCRSVSSCLARASSRASRSVMNACGTCRLRG